MIHLSHESDHETQLRNAQGTHKTGHHSVSGWDVREFQESCTVPVSGPPKNTLPRARGCRPFSISTNALSSSTGASKFCSFTKTCASTNSLLEHRCRQSTSRVRQKARRSETPSCSCRSTFQHVRPGYRELVTHEAHELLNLRLCQRFRHQVGGVHARADLRLRDKPA